MTASTLRHQAKRSQARAPFGSDPEQDRSAATAAARVSRASLVLGALGLASAIFLVVRLLESWRVTSSAASHHITIFGLRLGYPAANVDAIVIVLLAALGATVTARALIAAVREVQRSRRFHRLLSSRQPQLLHGALLIGDPHPRAFCAGLLRPRVYISTGAVAALDDGALKAVLAHERHHACRRDPLRLATGRVLARALFFMPELSDLVERQQALAELSADENAVNAAPANRSALARAMLSFSDSPASGEPSGVDPARIDYLLGDAPSWRFPALLCLAAISILALLLAVAVLAGRVASGSATLALPFLSHQPCVVVLAAIPAVLALGAMNYRNRLRPRWAESAVPSVNLLDGHRARRRTQPEPAGAAAVPVQPQHCADGARIASTTKTIAHDTHSEQIALIVRAHRK